MHTNHARQKKPGFLSSVMSIDPFSRQFRKAGFNYKIDK
jgi:hypothetical protein